MINFLFKELWQQYDTEWNKWVICEKSCQYETASKKQFRKIKAWQYYLFLK